MLLNSKRQRVHECTDPETAKCPLCGDKLVGRKPENRLWHWAHYPKAHDATDKEPCPHHESWWHLKMKLSAMAMGPEWEVEKLIEMGGKRYLLDVVHKIGDQTLVYEFVHTLTDYYWEKYEKLVQQGWNVSYILDGSEFISKRARPWTLLPITDSMQMTDKDDRLQVVRRLMKPKSCRFTKLMLDRMGASDKGRVVAHIHAQPEGLYRPLEQGFAMLSDWRDPRLVRYGMYKDDRWRGVFWETWPMKQSHPLYADFDKRMRTIDLNDYKNNPEEIQHRVKRHVTNQMLNLL